MRSSLFLAPCFNLFPPFSPIFPISPHFSRFPIFLRVHYVPPWPGDSPPCKMEETLPDRNAKEMAKEGFYLVKSAIATVRVGASLLFRKGMAWMRPPGTPAQHFFRPMGV